MLIVCLAERTPPRQNLRTRASAGRGEEGISAEEERRRIAETHRSLPLDRQLLAQRRLFENEAKEDQFTDVIVCLSAGTHLHRLLVDMEQLVVEVLDRRFRLARLALRKVQRSVDRRRIGTAAHDT